MIEGQDHRRLAENHFPGGSFGNGAAMRVAPVGLMFRDDHNTLWHQARLSALPTHMHPLGIEGAQVLALAVALAANSEVIARESFFETLAARCESLEFAGPLRRAAKIDDPKDLALFGNGIEATASVVTAIASFALTPHSYAHTVGHVIRLGGDTDTIAAMAGALSGAFLGKAAIPPHWLSSLEDGPRGKSYLEKLAEELLAA
jgi:poly(ADP-ribose) glycohydrolase ARH3